MVIITKTNLKTGGFANVNLFSSGLEISYAKIIDFDSLRFQIEFNFRDAKQFWGLEDFMNVNEVPLTNALNLSLFMVNLSQVLLCDLRQTIPESSILDLKAYLPSRQILPGDNKNASAKTRPHFIGADFRPGGLIGLYSSC